jgi:hypothetical protein
MSYVAFDFDGTVVTHDFPDIGKEVPGAIRVLKLLQDYGVSLILLTMRHGTTLDEAIKWLAIRGIDLYGANYNKSQTAWNKSRKVHRDFYIGDDASQVIMDRSFHERLFVDWKWVEATLRQRKLLPVVDVALDW